MKKMFKRLWSLYRQEYNRQEMLSVIIHCHVYGLVGTEKDIDKLIDFFGLD